MLYYIPFIFIINIFLILKVLDNFESNLKVLKTNENSPTKVHYNKEKSYSFSVTIFFTILHPYIMLKHYNATLLI